MSESEEEVTQGPNNHRTAPPVLTSAAQRSWNRSWQRSWQRPVDHQASEELSLSLRYDSSDSASCSLALAQNTATPASLPRYKISTCSFPLAQDTSTPSSLPLAGDTGVTGSSFVTPEWNADDDAIANDVDMIQGMDRGVHPDEHCFADFDCSEESVMRQGEEVTAPVVLSICGNPVKETKYFERRAFCIRMGVKPYKNKSKKEIPELIAQNVINNNIFDPIIKTKKTERSAPVLKQIQCPFRLTNVLFSGMFAARFVALSDTLSRADLDTQVSAEDQFWLDVRSSFVDNAPCLEFDNLIVTHPAQDAELIKPSLIVQHTVKQLCQIWGTAHGAYRKHTYASLRREQMVQIVMSFVKGVWMPFTFISI